MQKVAVLISYLGTNYCGWQTQLSAGLPRENEFPSIQSTFQSTLAKITGETVQIIGSGRTDSGVHAMGQVAHFTLKKKIWDPEILRKALNSQLPSEIRIRTAAVAHPDFHAQRSALKKQYSYFYQQGPCTIPHLERYSRWIRKPLKVDAMNEALAYLIGEHDFLPFRATGAKPGPSVRTIFEAEARLEPITFPGESSGFQLVRIRVVGSGFLKQMVRGIAGTLLQVGEGRRDPDCMQEILRTANRKLVGPTAPARALWLERVWYPPDLVNFGTSD